jgi:hypothetical protein
MSGAIPPLPQYAFVAWCLVKHRDNFTFTFLSKDIALIADHKNLISDGRIVFCSHRATVLSVPLPSFLSGLALDSYL